MESDLSTEGPNTNIENTLANITEGDNVCKKEDDTLANVTEGVDVCKKEHEVMDEGITLLEEAPVLNQELPSEHDTSSLLHSCENSDKKDNHPEDVGDSINVVKQEEDGDHAVADAEKTEHTSVIQATQETPDLPSISENEKLTSGNEAVQEVLVEGNTISEAFSYAVIEDVPEMPIYAAEVLSEDNYHIVVNDSEVVGQADSSEIGQQIIIAENLPVQGSDEEMKTICENQDLTEGNGAIITATEGKQIETLYVVNEDNDENIIVGVVTESDEHIQLPEIVDTISDNGKPLEVTQVLDTTEKRSEEPVAKAESVERKESSESTKKTEISNKPARPRKLPSHVLGRTIDNPSIDGFLNGKVIPKPRLGVKIPYRNLTSQIVSKEDLTNEVMERSRLRNSTCDAPEGGDLFFTKKLTQRLARKIASNSHEDKPAKEGQDLNQKVVKQMPSTSTAAPLKNDQINVKEDMSKKIKQSEISVVPKPVDAIKDNSDLIAILEGDDDLDWQVTETKSVENTKPLKAPVTKVAQETKKILDPEQEKAVALQQLKELPFLPKYKKQPSKTPEVTVLKTGSKPIYAPDKKSDSSVKLEKVKSALQTKILKVSDSTGLTETADNEKKETLTEKIKNLSHGQVTVMVHKTSDGTDKVTTPAKQEKMDTLTIKPVLQEKRATSDNIKTVPKPVVEKVKPSVGVPPTKTVAKPFLSPSVGANVKQSNNIPTKLDDSVNQLQKVDESNVPTKTVTKASAPNLPTKSVSKPTPAASIADNSKHSGPVITRDDVPEPRFSSKAVLKTYTRKRKSTDDAATNSNLKRSVISITDEIQTPASINLAPNTYISKSSRIVKRKVIWDPDEAIPLAKMRLPRLLDVKKSTPRERIPENAEMPKLLPLEKIKPPKVSGTPVPSEKAKLSKVSDSLEKFRNVQAPKQMMKRPAKLMVMRKSGILKPLTKTFKRAIFKKKKPKRLTEVDKLLMDEGAVNMLYAVKNIEDNLNVIKHKKSKSVISLDRAHRELMNRTNEIKNDLQSSVDTKESPKTLRKKESGPPKLTKEVIPAAVSRKKSRESFTSSIHSPPASPSFSPAEASRIIRRHSSSSFTTSDSEAEANQKKPIEQPTEIEVNHQKPVTTKVKKNKSTVNKLNSQDEINEVIIEEAKDPLSLEDKKVSSVEMSKNFKIVRDKEDARYVQYKTFKVQHTGNLVQIILTPAKNGHMMMSPVFFKEICAILATLKKNSDCHAVLLCSSADSFCEGIDYKSLVVTSDDCRKQLTGLLSRIRNFLSCLVKFPKLLIAGVHGNVVGLGVTMLPLFDFVWASDTATFFTPYSQLGCAAEGGSIFTLSQLMHHSLASELLFACRKLTSPEALKLGLVARIFQQNNFEDELISSARTISNHSLQGMSAIKKQLRSHWLPQADRLLSSETDALLQQWLTPECQINFSNYVLGEKIVKLLFRIMTNERKSI